MYKIATSHPVGTRVFTNRADAVKIALGMEIADPTNVGLVIVKLGSTLVRPRMGD
jgi:hypothetical protein